MMIFFLFVFLFKSYGKHSEMDQYTYLTITRWSTQRTVKLHLCWMSNVLRTIMPFLRLNDS